LSAARTLSLPDALPISAGYPLWLVGGFESGAAGSWTGSPPEEESEKPDTRRRSLARADRDVARHEMTIGPIGVQGVIQCTTWSRSEEHTSELQSRENLV